MKKNWVTIQYVIASILQGWALFFMYTLTEQIIARLHQGAELHLIKSSDVSGSFGTLFKIFHINYLAALLAFYGGFSLMYDKKSGWIASVAASLIFMGFMLVSGRNGAIGNNAAKMGGFTVGYLLAGFAFAAMFILLVLKPFREKFRPNFLNWLVIGGIVLLVLIDKQAI